MSGREIKISENVHHKVAALGKVGARWLAELPALVEQIEQDWQIKVGQTLHGGSEAFVALVTTAEGEKAVLKVSIPSTEVSIIPDRESLVLRLGAGYGYAHLLRYDTNRRALLLEALGPKLEDLNFSSRAQLEIICATLQKSWVRVPPETPLPDGVEAGNWHHNFMTTLWQKLNRPGSEAVFETGLRFSENRARAYDPSTAVLVHGDAHSNNVLQVPGESTRFKLIDPDGVIAEPACDLGVLMREWPDELLVNPVKVGRERCELLAELTGVDPNAIWEWGFIQVVSTGLLFLSIGQTLPGQKLLSIADAWTRA